MGDDREERRDTARLTAWATRRERYGQRGHAGTYWRGGREPYYRRPLARLVAFVWGGGVLSEGQIAKVLQTDIVSVRELRDEGRDNLEVHPPKGEWAKHAMQRMEW